MTIQPLYIIPLLIKQPTWGGSHIAATKKLLHPVVRDQKIGQSYELSADSRVSADPAAQECFIVTDSGLNEAQQFGPAVESFDLQSVVRMDPVAMLGEPWASIDPTLQLLVKYNQAKNNSYQVHVRPGKEFHGWQTKPETWYYLADGKATLGIKQGADLAQYRRDCEAIDALAQVLRQKIKNEELDVATARTQLAAFIEERHPRRYVNTVVVPRGSVINLWQGGIHHSWEADETVPNGNIVYEVQLSVKDERSTLRSFDQGNIKDSGDIRPLHVADYFEALNTSPIDNAVEKLMTQPQGHQEGVTRLTLLCETPYYKLEQIEFTGAGPAVRTTSSFHHLYVEEGEVELEWQDRRLEVMTGRSLFVPAACGRYVLSASPGSRILQTSLPQPA